MPTVLVTGGSGFIGRAVVEKLLALGCEVRVLARSPKKVPARPGVEIVAGGLDDAAALERACAGAQAVVHLVGIIAEKGGETFEGVHVEGTRAVLAAARKAGIRRYLHMSALGARLEGDARYPRTKAQAEALVRESGLDWTIFRPSIVFGPGDRFVNQFAAMFRFPWNWLQIHTFPLIGGGKTRLQPVSVDDVAAAFAGALSRAEAVGQTYDLVGGEALSLQAILQEVAAATGTRYVVDGPVPFRLFGRALVWLAVAAFPLLLALALVQLAFLLHPAVLFGSSPEAKIRALDFSGGTVVHVSPWWWLPALLWAFAVVIALRWRTLVFFPLFWWEARLAARFLQRLPNPPLTVEQVKMLRTDNTGDPAPAASAFGLKLAPFRAGIRAYLNP